jgi:hypothetical protein
MTVIFLGSGHDDPSGSERLQRSVRRLKSQYGSEPDFVAFEYAWSTYTALASRRADLAVTLKAQFPQLPEEFISHFANTLVYEGDLSEQVVVPSRSVWMLDGREQDDVRIAGDRLAAAGCGNKSFSLRGWLLPRMPNWTELTNTELLKEAIAVYVKHSQTLASLSGAGALRANGLEESIRTGRDSYMFESLRIELAKPYPGDHLGIVIVGATHLLDVPGSLFNLCRAVTRRAERVWPHQQ